MASPKHIAIVEGDALDAVKLEDVLGDEGYVVEELSDSESPIGKITASQPKIVLINPDDGSGIDESDLSSLRDELGRSDIVVVLLSNRDAAELDELCESYLLNGYFRKSRDYDELPVFIQKFF